MGQQEPIVNTEQINGYTRQIEMQGCHSNINNKVWFLWSNDFEVVTDTEQGYLQT